MKLLFFIFVLFFQLKIFAVQDFDDELLDDSDQEKKKEYNIDIPLPGDPMTSFWDDESAKEEEEIERFYEFGRFVHIAPFYEYAFPTGPMSQIYLAGPFVGLKFSYFFDWNLAYYAVLSVGFIPISIPIKGEDTSDLGVKYIEGQNHIFNFIFALKYYFNLMDISKVLAFVNPYVTFGLESMMFMESVDEVTNKNGYAENSGLAFGIFFSGGIEFYVYKKEILLGLEFMYHWMFFDPYNQNIWEPSNPYYNLDYSGHYFGFAFNIIWSF